MTQVIDDLTGLPLDKALAVTLREPAPRQTFVLNLRRSVASTDCQINTLRFRGRTLSVPQTGALEMGTS
jgi:hypothetical protein